MPKPEVQSILKLRVPVIVRLASHRMKLGEVLNLGPGSLMEVPRAADEPLDLMVNNKPIGKGHAVKVGENFGLKIEAIGAAADRIRALGPDTGTSEQPDQQEPASSEAEQSEQPPSE